MPPRFNRKNFETLNFGGWVRKTRLNGHSLPSAAFTGKNRYPSIKKWNGEDYYQEDTIILKHFYNPQLHFFNLIRVLWHISKNLQYTSTSTSTHTHTLSLSHTLTHKHRSLTHTHSNIPMNYKQANVAPEWECYFFQVCFQECQGVFLKGSQGPSFEQFHICYSSMTYNL